MLPMVAMERTKFMMLVIMKLWLAKRLRSMIGSFTNNPEAIKATRPKRLKPKQERM